MNILYVDHTFSGLEDGSRETPFTTVEQALTAATPGDTVQLISDDYPHNVNIEVSGTITAPIRLCSESGQCVISNEWYMYDSSDIILTGFIFKNIPNQALSIIGNCERNSISHITFIDCGTSDKTPCTLFFGGVGLKDNIVEECNFQISEEQRNSLQNNALPVGVILSNNNLNNNEPVNTHHVFRSNLFINYGEALVLGSHDNPTHEYFHLVENNIIQGTRDTAIKLRCGGSTIKDNMISGAGNIGISVLSGGMIEIQNNRIEFSQTSVHLENSDTIVSHNTFLKFHTCGVTISDGVNSDNSGLMLIENNTFISNSPENSSISPQSHRQTIIQKNIFADTHTPIDNNESTDHVHISNNITNITNITDFPCQGCTIHSEELFTNSHSGDYQTQIHYGSKGSSAGTELLSPQENSESLASVIAHYTGTYSSEELEKTLKNYNIKDLYSQSYRIDDENLEEGSDDSHDDEPPEITDYSTWDTM